MKNTEASKRFYIDVVGLEFGYRDSTRDAVFLMIGSNRSSMLGLWRPGTNRGDDFHKGHFVIAMPLSELLAFGKRLVARGVACHTFTGEETTLPSVIGWLPSAQLYFNDPDGHSVEFISIPR